MNSLIPFTPLVPALDLKIQAEGKKINETTLRLEFTFHGDLKKIRWPENTTAQRQDQLWEHTCLECFFKTDLSESAYTEINCSPTGAWNSYHFDSYRHGMRPALNFQVALTHSTHHGDMAVFTFEVHSKQSFSLTALGLSAVIECSDGNVSYWALSHPAVNADFHDAQAWTGLSTR